MLDEHSQGAGGATANTSSLTGPPVIRLAGCRTARRIVGRTARRANGRAVGYRREMIDVIRRRALVSGVVQGVGFRFSTEGEADRIGVAGFVRNLPDGRVEVEVEGEPHDVEKLLTWLRDGGPSSARVDSVEIDERDPTGASDFETR